MQTYLSLVKLLQRKKQLEKLQLEDMQISNRKYPFVEFKPDESRNNMLKVENLTKSYRWC